MFDKLSRIAEALRRSAAYWVAPVALASLLIVLHLPGEAWLARLVYDRDHIIAGEFWRLFTGHFVHWNLNHLALNVAALAIWIPLCARTWSWQAWAGVLLLLCGGISAGLWLLWPDTWRYAGFSGVAHGLFVLGLAPQLRRGDWLAGACLLYLVFKVSFEQWQGAPLSGSDAIGVRVATEAHLLGTMAAGVMIMTLGLALRLRHNITGYSNTEEDP